MKKLLLIINPQAGKKAIRNQLFELAELFEQNGYFVGIRITKYAGQATEIVREFGAQFDAIVVCGGDGTIDEVVGGLMELENKPVLGIIPGGTINDLAHSFGISRNIRKAAEQFLAGEQRAYDIGVFQKSQYFSYVAAFGMFTEVAYATAQGDKNTFGRLAYLINGLASMTNVEPCHTKVAFDGGSFEDEYIFGAVCNTISIGGFQQFQKENISLADGVLEGLFIKKPDSILGYQQVFSNFLAQNYDESVMKFVQSPWFDIQTEKEIKWILDGEDRGKHDRVNIQTIPQAITVVRQPLTTEE